MVTKRTPSPKRSTVRGVLAPRGFTLLELLVVIGVLLILIGLVLPLLRTTKQAAGGARCGAELRQWSAQLSIYAQDNRDLLPTPIDADLRLPGTSLILNEAPAPSIGGYELVCQLWPFAITDRTSDVFADPVLCPSNSGQRRERTARAVEGNIQVEQQNMLADRAISMAYFLDPKALDPAKPAWSRGFFRTQKLSSTAYPAQKALLFDTLPFHRVDDPYLKSIPIGERALIVGAADGSVSPRSVTSTRPGVVFKAPRHAATAELERQLASLFYTPEGVLGRDW